MNLSIWQYRIKKNILNKIWTVIVVTWKENFTQIYIDEKGEFKKKTRNGIIILCIGLTLIIFSIIVPGKALILPATAVCITISIILYKNRNIKKDDKIRVNDTLKRLDDPDKYT
jgi:hypothetical protein